MNTQLNENQIKIKVKDQNQVIIFDADNLLKTEHDEELDQSKTNGQQKNYQQQNQDQILQIVKDQQQKGDPQLISKIENELKHTKQNLFNINMINQTHKKPKNKIKSLESIRKVEQHTVNSILKQGYMQKKIDGIIFKWKRRFFTLTPQKLFFFEDNTKQKIIGCVNIKLIQLQIKLQKDEIMLDFNGQSENIYLKCQNKQQTQQWIQWLEQVSKYQSKEKKILLNTMNKPFYQQTNTISQRQFRAQAETGDVLLFYTNHIGAKIQRMFTNSDFDHVAMVVKFRSYQLMIFQSNIKNGVALFQWGQYVKCCNLYQKITYRKLISPRKQQIQHNLLKFVRANLGKNYSLNFSKLFTFQSDFNWQTLKQDSNRGYFCSQLLAKSYKSAGLLDPKKSSCRYWPVDFSEKNNLQFLVKGTYLGPQQQIILNKHVKKLI